VAEDQRFHLAGLEPTRFGLGGRRLSPFVGRELELRFLLERLDRARSELGQVVWITGEPGVGKSRLLYEFRQRLDTLGVPCLEGRCASHGAAVPYYLLHDLLRGAWDLPDDPGDLLPAVRARLDALSIGDAEAAGILATWLGATTERPPHVAPEAVRQRAFEIMRDILLVSARPSACVVLLEDLHWIDQGSAEFLAGLVEHVAAAPIFVVLSARAGHVVPMVDRSFVSRLALPPLSRQDSEMLAQAVLPASGHLVSRIVDRAGGNPFFLEELLWAVADGGADAAVPDTVTAALMARMDRLDAPQRRVLETAAVLGREVPLPLLTAMQAGEPDLPRLLDALVRLEFFYLQPGPTYVFKHALTRDVAYSRRSLAERWRLHAAAARAFETVAPHRLEELAHHWDQTEDHLKAIDYGVRFVEQATARYALTEALTALQRALIHCDALAPGPDRDRRTVTTAMQAALPLLLLGRTREIKDVLQPHVPLVERLTDPRISAPFFFSLTLAADHTADHDAAEAFGARAVEEARRYRDLATEGRALVMLGFSSMWASEHRRGVERARRAVECLELPAEAFWRGHGLLVESQLLLMLGELEGGRLAAEALQSVGEMVGDRRLQAYGIVYAAMETMMRGDLTTALHHARHALDTASDPLGRATIMGYVGEIATRAGDITLAKESLTAALEFVRSAHFRQLEAWDLARLAEAELAGGNLQRAEFVAREAADLAAKINFPYVRGRAGHVRGEVALATGPVDEAMGHLRSAIDIFTRIEAPYEWGRTMVALASVQAAGGDLDAATRSRAEALETAKRIGANLGAVKAILMIVWGYVNPALEVFVCGSPAA
jgi:adenylate cyclase